MTPTQTVSQNGIESWLGQRVVRDEQCWSRSVRFPIVLLGEIFKTAGPFGKKDGASESEQECGAETW